MMKCNGTCDVNTDDVAIEIPKIVQNKVSNIVNITFEFELIKKSD